MYVTFVTSYEAFEESLGGFSTADVLTAGRAIEFATRQIGDLIVIEKIALAYLGNGRVIYSFVDEEMADKLLEREDRLAYLLAMASNISTTEGPDEEWDNCPPSYVNNPDE